MSVDRLVVGLGNPGLRYRSTRHNLGFRVVERLRDRLSAGAERGECGAFVATAGSLLLACPQTYMNRSGMAVRCLTDLHALDPERLLVIYDDVALPFSRLRIRPSGGAGGHRGMESIIESLQTEEFARLRLGIANPEVEHPGTDLADFVLRPFDRDEQDAVGEMVDRAALATMCWVEEGVGAAMNRFNG